MADGGKGRRGLLLTSQNGVIATKVVHRPGVLLLEGAHPFGVAPGPEDVHCWNCLDLKTRLGCVAFWLTMAQQGTRAREDAN